MYYFIYMAKQYIIGIDPGKSGGIATLYNNKIINISKMPLSPELLYEHFLYLGLPNNYKGELTIILENVHSMPTDGVRQSFTFGRGLGHIEGVIATMGLYGTLKRISPMAWMKHFNMQKLKEEKKQEYKNRLKALAIKLANQKFTLNTCDAYLIAKYQSEVLNERQNENISI